VRWDPVRVPTRYSLRGAQSCLSISNDVQPWTCCYSARSVQLREPTCRELAAITHRLCHAGWQALPLDKQSLCTSRTRFLYCRRAMPAISASWPFTPCCLFAAISRLCGCDFIRASPPCRAYRPLCRMINTAYRVMDTSMISGLSGIDVSPSARHESM